MVWYLSMLIFILAGTAAALPDLGCHDGLGSMASHLLQRTSRMLRPKLLLLRVDGWSILPGLLRSQLRIPLLICFSQVFARLYKLHDGFEITWLSGEELLFAALIKNSKEMMSDKDMQLPTDLANYAQVVSKFAYSLGWNCRLTGARALGMPFCKAMKFGAVAVFRLLAALVWELVGRNLLREALYNCTMLIYFGGTAGSVGITPFVKHQCIELVWLVCAWGLLVMSVKMWWFGTWLWEVGSMSRIGERNSVWFEQSNWYRVGMT